MLRYLLDENVPHALAVALRRHESGLVIWLIGDPTAPPPGSADPVLLAWCEVHDFVLITNNRSSMSRHLAEHLRQDRHLPGGFILNPKLSLAETVANLVDAAELSLEGEYRDQLRHLPL
jgi:hypothetical protein